jgi:hypothetical protein
MGYVESLMGKNEKILVVARQHWTTLLMSFLINLFIVVVVLVVYALLGNVPALLGVRAFVLLALLYPLGKFGWDLIQWEAEQYIVSTHRVIQTEGIVNKKTVDSSLEKVNDIVLTQSVLGRILGYGNLEILTGSDIGVNLLTRLADPVKFKTALLDAKAEMHDHDDLPGRSAAGVPVGGALMPDAHKAKGAASPAADDDSPLAQIKKLDELRKAGAINEIEYNDAKAKLLAKL